MSKSLNLSRMKSRRKRAEREYQEATSCMRWERDDLERLEIASNNGEAVWVRSESGTVISIRRLLRYLRRDGLYPVANPPLKCGYVNTHLTSIRAIR